jgi:8-oxo-dGTP pyrophosphatase MutT (NUDIX family)
VEHSVIINAGALIYCSSTQRYLFLLRNGHSHEGSWGLAGGKIEDGETISDGLFREIREELGVDLSSQKIIPVEKFTGESDLFIYHTFVIRVDAEFTPTLNDEHRGYAWVHLKDHPRPLHPGVWRSFNFQTIIEKCKTLEQVLSTSVKLRDL